MARTAVLSSMTCRSTFLFSVLSCAIGISACRRSAATTDEEVVQVRADRVAMGEIDVTTEVVASIKSRHSVLLQPHVEGLVTKILVTPGDRVTRLTPLMQIDPAKQQATLQGVVAAQGLAQSEQARARAVLASTTASRASKLAHYKYSQQQAERTKRLFENHLTTAQEVDLQQRSLETSKAELDALDSDIAAQEANITASEQRINQTQANAREQQEQLRYYTIVAPFDGIVGDVPVKVGERVTASSRLTTIDDNDTLEAYVYVPAERAADLRLGMVVQLLSPTGESRVESRISFLSPQVETMTQTVLIKSTFANDKAILRSGQLVRARIVWNAHSGLIIPRTAVVSMHGQSFVFVVQPPSAGHRMTVKQQPVELGPLDGNDHPVLRGLSEGDQVVVLGVQKLADGTPVALLEPRKE